MVWPFTSSNAESAHNPKNLGCAPTYDCVPGDDPGRSDSMEKAEPRGQGAVPYPYTPDRHHNLSPAPSGVNELGDGDNATGGGGHHVETNHVMRKYHQRQPPVLPGISELDNGPEPNVIMRKPGEIGGGEFLNILKSSNG